MNEIDRLKALDAAARAADEPGPIDVTRRAMASISRGAARTDVTYRLPTNWGLAWGPAIAAMVIALVMAGLTWQAIDGLSDPLNGVFGSLSLVMQ